MTVAAMSVAAPSLPLTATELSDLAVRARNSAEQDRMIAQNVHAAPLALLLEGTAPLETQAQAARLLANLAFQPPNKIVITEAGAVEALQATLERTLLTLENAGQTSLAADDKALAAVLVEAAAALGNLSSGRSLRERCADASCPVPRVLIQLLELWSPVSDRSLGFSTPAQSEPDQDAVTYPGRRVLGFNAAAAEATRALSSLSASRNAHPALMGSHLPLALLALVDKTAAARGGVIGGATARVCLECGADTTDEDDAAAASSSEEDDNDADQTAAMLSRALLALTNLLGDPRRAAAVCDVRPTLPETAVRALAAATRPPPADGGGGRSYHERNRSESYHELRRRAVAFAALAVSNLSGAGARMLETGLVDAVAALLRAAAAEAEAARAAVEAAEAAAAEAAAEAAARAASVAGLVAELVASVLTRPLGREALIEHDGLSELLLRLHAAWSVLAEPSPLVAAEAAANGLAKLLPRDHREDAAPNPEEVTGAAARAAFRKGRREAIATAGLDREAGWSTEAIEAWIAAEWAARGARAALRDVCRAVEAVKPGATAAALSAHEPPLWSGCARCAVRALQAVGHLAVSPPPAAARGGALPRAVALLPSLPPAAQRPALGALLAVVRGASEAAVPLALAGGVPLLQQLSRSRRAGGRVRDAAAVLLCVVARHGELHAHCTQHGVLAPSPPSSPSTSSRVRKLAADAALDLCRPPHALLPLLARGEAHLSSTRAPRGATPRPPLSSAAQGAQKQCETLAPLLRRRLRRRRRPRRRRRRSRGRRRSCRPRRRPLRRRWRRCCSR